MPSDFTYNWPALEPWLLQIQQDFLPCKRMCLDHQGWHVWWSRRCCPRPWSWRQVGLLSSLTIWVLAVVCHQQHKTAWCLHQRLLRHPLVFSQCKVELEKNEKSAFFSEGKQIIFIFHGLVFCGKGQQHHNNKKTRQIEMNDYGRTQYILQGTVVCLPWTIRNAFLEALDPTTFLAIHW